LCEKQEECEEKGKNEIEDKMKERAERKISERNCGRTKVN
jgi:hypothetical protein